MKVKAEEAIDVEINTGMSLDDANKLFPDIFSRRGKYLIVAQRILNQSKELNPLQIHPCELKNGNNATVLGLVHFTNDYLKENKSHWRLKFSPVSEKYALYNLELLGKSPKDS